MMLDRIRCALFGHLYRWSDPDYELYSCTGWICQRAGCGVIWWLR